MPCLMLLPPTVCIPRPASVALVRANRTVFSLTIGVTVTQNGGLVPAYGRSLMQARESLKGDRP